MKKRYLDIGDLVEHKKFEGFNIIDYCVDWCKGVGVVIGYDDEKNQYIIYWIGNEKVSNHSFRGIIFDYLKKVKF